MDSGRRGWHEGLPFVLGSLTAGLATARSAPRASLALGLFGLACAAFFRDPDRDTPREPETVFSAADGRVLSVERVEEPWWIGGLADRVAVFLSIADVHVNRFPVDGQLVAVKKIPGRYAPAMLYAENNCRDLLALQGPRGPVLIAQISGLIARRSVQWCDPGDHFQAGDRLGMIRFGSRTDIYLPAGRASIQVAPGDRVVAGLTRIARYTNG